MTAKPPIAVKAGILLVLVLLLAIGLKLAGKGLGRAYQPMTQARSQPLTAAVAEHLKRLEAPFQSLNANAAALQPSVEPLYTASALRDPLQSLLPSEEAVAMPTTTDATVMPMAQAPQLPPVVALQGVFWGGAVPTAIINGEVYGIGDAVSGATIRAIDRRGIELEFQGATYRMTMQGTTTRLSRELPWR